MVPSGTCLKRVPAGKPQAIPATPKEVVGTEKIGKAPDGLDGWKEIVRKVSLFPAGGPGENAAASALRTTVAFVEEAAVVVAEAATKSISRSNNDCNNNNHNRSYRYRN